MRINKASTKSQTTSHDSVPGTWIDKELAECTFGDVRLAKRYSKLLGMLS